MNSKNNLGDTSRMQNTKGDTCEKPSYPIFWPSFGTLKDGFQERWFWFDAGVSGHDQGPFETEAEAKADWGVKSFTAAVAFESAVLADVIDRLPKLPSPAYLLNSLDAMDVSEPKAREPLPAKAHFVELCNSIRHQQELAEVGLQIVSQMAAGSSI